MKNEDQELKKTESGLNACPFCGRENPSEYFDNDYYTIQCPKCGAMMCDSKYFPADRWNKRQNDTEKEVLRQKVKELEAENAKL